MAVIGDGHKHACKDIHFGHGIPPVVLISEILDRLGELCGQGDSYSLADRCVLGGGHTVLNEKLVIAALFDQLAVDVVEHSAHSLVGTDRLYTADKLRVGGQVDVNNGTVDRIEVIITVVAVEYR